MASELFSFTVSPLELFVRGTVTYWALFLLFRFVLQRDAGALGIADVLMIVLIADAAQNGMAGEYKTVSEGLLLIATLGGWNYLIDWAAYRFPLFRGFAEPSPVPLVESGAVLKPNLRRQMLTEEELLAQLRLHGVERPDQVKRAVLESDGHVSVILIAARPQQRPHEQSPVPG